MKEKTKIKEERATRKEVPIERGTLKDLFFRKKLDDIINNRASNFWEDVDGITDLLNKSQSKIIITHPNSPIISHYLLWRILNELKLQNINKKT